MSIEKKPWQLALIEAMTVASEFIVPESERRNFLIIGGAALVQYGSDRSTADVDIAITPKTLKAFTDGAESDARFKFEADGHWVYTCQGAGVEDLQVPFEFLDIGGEFVAPLHGPSHEIGSVRLASLPDIARMKAKAYRDRDENSDFRDLLFVLGKLKERGWTLAGHLTEEEIMTIQTVVSGTRGDSIFWDVKE